MHHINGEGEDAGVVYCEMQARENTADERVQFQLLQVMYPGDCGYKVRVCIQQDLEESGFLFSQILEVCYITFAPAVPTSGLVGFE